MALKKHESNAPIFIVGPPRSGTSLISAIIGSHSRIACGPETDVFRAIPVSTANKIANDRDWVEKAVKELDKIKYPDGLSIAHHFGLTVADIRVHLDSKNASASEIYGAIPEAFAFAQGKSRWAEKTPRHLFYLDLIRKLYPDAKIIRIMRDPRDSVPSVIKNIGLSASPIGEFYRWMSAFMISHPFFENDLNSITIRYEDLVEDPDKAVRKICEFLGEEFESSMLKRSGAEHVRVASETWKQDIDKKITADNIFAWKSNMDTEIARAASLICCEALELFDYPEPVKPQQEIKVFPLGENFGIANQSHIIDCARKGYRYTAIPMRYPATMGEALTPYPNVMLGDLPLGKKATSRLSLCCQAIIRIVYRYLVNKPVTVDPNIRLGVGTLNQMVGKIALIFGNQRSFAD